MTKVLTMKFGADETVEVHLLNPGGFFPDFGGSRHGLVVGKTASLVLRRRSRMGVVDEERDIHDAAFWGFMGAMLSGSGERPHVVETHPPEPADLGDDPLGDWHGRNA